MNIKYTAELKYIHEVMEKRILANSYSKNDYDNRCRLKRDVEKIVRKFKGFDYSSIEDYEVICDLTNNLPDDINMGLFMLADLRVKLKGNRYYRYIIKPPIK